MESLAGRVAVVTGAASGMGRSMALRFARSGMDVVLADVEEPALAAAASEVDATGVRSLAVVADVSDAAAMDHLAEAAFERFGTVHVVCNNAGVGTGGPIWEMTTQDWEWVLGVNLWGVVHGLRVFVPRLVEQDEGHVVNTASIAGLTSHAHMGPYNASKHAVVTISETLWHELRTSGSKVGVTVLCPGLVNTGILDSSRNRPERLLGRAAREPTPAEEARWQAIRDLYSAALSPDAVADMVYDAVLEDRLYILTDDAFDEAIRTRHEDVQQRRNPTPKPGLFA